MSWWQGGVRRLLAGAVQQDGAAGNFGAGGVFLSGVEPAGVSQGDWDGAGGIEFGGREGLEKTFPGAQIFLPIFKPGR